MGDKTGIEWTDATWNPIRGCSRVSEGCRNCYAERVAHRFSGPGQPYEGLTVNGKWNAKTTLVEKHLFDPLIWQKPRKIFANSMSDLFHESVPDEWIDKIVMIMARAGDRGHRFQILTKRPDRMRQYFLVEDRHERWNVAHRHMKETNRVYARAARFSGRCGRGWWPEFSTHIWLGVSVENQATADKRIPILLDTPAAVRFISAEPLLGPIDLQKRGGVDWIIVGGESGPGSRPMHPDWARTLRDQCLAEGTPFFFKQWGEYAPIDGSMVRVGKTKAGRLLDGVEHNEFPLRAWHLPTIT